MTSVLIAGSARTKLFFRAAVSWCTNSNAETIKGPRDDLCRPYSVSGGNVRGPLDNPIRQPCSENRNRAVCCICRDAGGGE